MLLTPTEDSLWNSDALFGLYQSLMTLPFPLTNVSVLPETFYDVRRMVTLCRVTGYFNLVSEALSLLTIQEKMGRFGNNDNCCFWHTSEIKETLDSFIKPNVCQYVSRRFFQNFLLSFCFRHLLFGHLSLTIKNLLFASFKVVICASKQSV